LIPWGLVAILILVNVALRWRLLSVPFERDEGEYAYIGQLLLRGTPPFRLAYTMKLPGTPMIYAASMSLLGETVEGARAGLIMLTSGTILMVFLLGRSLLGSRPAVAAASAQAMMALSPGMLGPFGHATHYAAFFGIAGLLVLRLGIRRRGRWMLGAASLLLGLAPLMKQSGAVFVAIGAVWLWLDRGARPLAGRKKLAKDALVFIAGSVSATAVLLVWSASAGTFGRLWFWTFDYARQYGVEVPPRDAFAALVEGVKQFVPESALLWALGIAGLLALVWPARGMPNSGKLLWLVAGSFLGVCAGFHFRDHYFLLLVPALALLVGAAVRAADRAGLVASRAALLLTLLASSQPIVAQRHLFFDLGPTAVSRAVYGANPFPESLEISRYLRAHSTPEQRIAVLGSEPQIYFYAQRTSATGYIYMYGLMENQPLAERMRAEMVQEIVSAKPEFVVTVDIDTSWLVTNDSGRELFGWIWRYLASEYRIVGSATIVSPERTDYRWDDEARGGAPAQVLVFRRNSPG
jgi:hypothetical protein